MLTFSQQGLTEDKPIKCNKNLSRKSQYPTEFNDIQYCDGQHKFYVFSLAQISSKVSMYNLKITTLKLLLAKNFSCPSKQPWKLFKCFSFSLLYILEWKQAICYSLKHKLLCFIMEH